MDSVGLGVSLVPHRVLPLYERRKTVRRVAVEPRFRRERVVVVRKNRQPPEHVAGFVKGVLFG
jgi:DNA-binding transcriptional LysR family regulator